MKILGLESGFRGLGFIQGAVGNSLSPKLKTYTCYDVRKQLSISGSWRIKAPFRVAFLLGVPTALNRFHSTTEEESNKYPI